MEKVDIFLNTAFDGACRTGKSNSSRAAEVLDEDGEERAI